MGRGRGRNCASNADAVAGAERDIYVWLTRHGLPYHPALDSRYVSIGDVHTTRPLSAVGDLEATRFLV